MCVCVLVRTLAVLCPKSSIIYHKEHTFFDRPLIARAHTHTPTHRVMAYVQSCSRGCVSCLSVCLFIHVLICKVLMYSHTLQWPYSWARALSTMHLRSAYSIQLCECRQGETILYACLWNQSEGHERKYDRLLITNTSRYKDAETQGAAAARNVLKASHHTQPLSRFLAPSLFFTHSLFLAQPLSSPLISSLSWVTQPAWNRYAGPDRS